ncbi:hypothetical protein [Microbacterium hydrocarbonoxydans]|uniref:hypothetical protein n=1 Tax=Microbacterium hydrocarbonoxydans TaxID=273678 RepID=UPI0013DA6D03|nr:hypothetical protein [Microbacterium hydrocarbonoxydans]
MMSDPSSEAPPDAHDPSRRSYWQLQAAALADTRGRVVAMVALDGSEQRDVVEYFADRYCYVIDEAVGLDLHGRVVNCRTSRSGTTDSVPGTSACTPAGDQAVGRRLPTWLAKIVVLDCDSESPALPTVEHLSLESALQALVPMSRGLRKLQAPLRTIEAVLAATGGAVRIRYRHPSTLSSSLADFLEFEPPSRPARVRSESAFGVVDLQASRGDRFFRSAVLDALSLEFDKTAVLFAGTASDELRVLDKIESDVWRAASGSPREALEAAWNMGGSQDDRKRTGGLSEVLRGMVSGGLLSNDPAWRIGDAVAWTYSRDRVTVLNLEASSPQPIVLEGSAIIIWSIIAGNGSILQPRLIEECATSVGLDASVVTGDVVRVLHELHSRGVLVPC